MSQSEELIKLRKEAKDLRQSFATYFKAWSSQKDRADLLEDKLKEALGEIKELKKELEDVKKKLIHESEIKETYRNMIFKSNSKTKSNSSKRSLGAQIGHRGVSRKSPERIDIEKEVYISHCPECKTRINQSNSFYTRIIEDIVIPLNTIVTKYQIQRQWCSNCHKEIYATPEGTIENSPFGINTLIWILVQKYSLRLPLKQIIASLKTQYGLNITAGAIQKNLHNLKDKLASKYEELIKEIKENKIKHADETGWRINGQNGWCWMFSSTNSIIYTIEETRGKGIPEKILGKSPPGILIRDDYAAYKNIDMPQQSCWAHLLRNSKERAEKENSSEEMKQLHAILKTMFFELNEIIEKNKELTKEKRSELHNTYQKKIQNIIDNKYASLDATEIQTRIKNQNTNLITALLYPDVPLTNNEAERNIRKIVVTRKISGGSRSKKGAETHSINMSIIQTLIKRNEPLIAGLLATLNSKTT